MPKTTAQQGSMLKKKKQNFYVTTSYDNSVHRTTPYITQNMVKIINEFGKVPGYKLISRYEEANVSDTHLYLTYWMNKNISIMLWRIIAEDKEYQHEGKATPKKWDILPSSVGFQVLLPLWDMYKQTRKESKRAFKL